MAAMREQKLEGETISFKISKREASRCHHKRAFYGCYRNGITYYDIQTGNNINLSTSYHQ